MLYIKLSEGVHLLRLCKTENIVNEYQNIGSWFWAEYRRSDCSYYLNNVFGEFGIEVIIKKELKLLLLCDRERKENKYLYYGKFNNIDGVEQLKIKIHNDNTCDGFLSVNENNGKYEIYIKNPKEFISIERIYDPYKIIKKIGIPLFEFNKNIDSDKLNLIFSNKNKILRAIDYGLYVKFPVINFNNRIIYNP